MDLPQIDADKIDHHDTSRIIWIKVRDAAGLLWGDNPKAHDMGALISSIQKYGFQELPKYDQTLGGIVSGNGRTLALIEMEKVHYAVPRGIATIDDNGAVVWVMPVLVGTNAESEQIAVAYAIDANNLTMAGGDFDAVDFSKLWEPDKYLALLGLLGDEMPVTVDGDDLAALIKYYSGEDDKYVRNIQAPIYTPKGEKPGIPDLYDETKTLRMIAEIDVADLPEEEKEFLRVAARRHTVLNYKCIAEYYSHSAADVQRLMEDSALVIIDFGRAIELGYVVLAEKIAEQFKQDYPNE